jgi:hypothetical protein
MEELEMMQNVDEETTVDENVEEIDNEDEQQSVENTGEESTVKNEIPLHTFLDEKRRRKELEKRVREFEQEKMSKDKVEKIEKIRSKVKEKGYDDDFADLLGAITDELYSAIPKSSGKSEDDFLIDEIRDAQDYGGLKDAIKYKDQIIARMKKNGLTVEEAYRLEVGSKQRELNSEKRTQEEQIAAMKRRQAAGDKAVSSASDSSKTSYSLTAEEKKEFEAMKKLRPDRELTVEKFKKLRSMYT